MTLPAYVLPFATTKAVSPVVVRETDTLPVVSVQLVDEEGNPEKAEGWTSTLRLFNAMSEETAILGVYEDEPENMFYYPWASAPAKGEFRSEVQMTLASDSIHYPGPRVYVYDPEELWADPQTVIALAGGTYSTDEAIVAIMVATNAVRAWATVPVPSPVPDSVRGAVAILAARVLTTPPAGSTQAVPVISERIGDYSVRYAEAGNLSIAGTEAEGLLAWLKPGSYQVDIGPKDGEGHSVSSGYAPPLIIEEEEVVP